MSLSIAGLIVSRFSAMNPCSCWLSAEMLPEIWSSAALWLSSCTSSALVFAIRLTTWPLRSASTAVDLLALVSSPRSCASRSLRVSENRATPSTAILSSGGVSENVSDNTLSESDNWLVFSPLIVVASSPSASGS